MISHAHEAIFVHVPKTGGQSVEAVFLKALGLTWRDRAQLLMRANLDRAAGPKKLAHLYADEYVARGHIGQVQFDSYARFAIVRHPYDRMISEFRYRVAAKTKRGMLDPDGSDLNFDRFIGQVFEDDFSDTARHLVPQRRFLYDKTGQCLVDRVFRFDRFAQDLPPYLSQLIGRPIQLPHRNPSRGMPGFSRADLSAAQRRVLENRYKVDFETFGFAP